MRPMTSLTARTVMMIARLSNPKLAMKSAMKTAMKIVMKMMNGYLTTTTISILRKSSSTLCSQSLEMTQIKIL